MSTKDAKRDSAVSEKEATKEAKKEVPKVDVAAAAITIQIDPSIVEAITVKAINGADKGKIAKAITPKVEKLITEALSKELAPAMSEAITEALRSNDFKQGIQRKLGSVVASVLGMEKTRSIDPKAGSERVAKKHKKAKTKLK